MIVRNPDAPRPHRAQRSRRALSAVAVTVAALAGSTIGTPAVAAPVACPWLARAQQVLDDLQGSLDPRATRLVPALQRAIATCPSGTAERPYFAKADWLWSPIVDDPVLDPDSAAMVKDLASGGEYIANIGDFGVTLVEADKITDSTPRFSIKPSQYGPALSDVPIPADTEIAPGSDGHLAVADPLSGKVYNFWIARKEGDGWTAAGGAATDLDGDGRETSGGTSTGSNIARFAAVVRISEIEQGVIPHALFFSTDMAKAGECRYPAAKTDGSNDAGLGNPIPEGARVQLDPAVDVDALDATPAVKMIAKALQTYGAYVGDNGGARVAFLFEYGPDSPVYKQAGLSGGFAPIPGIPWDRMRVLAAWNGTNDGGQCSGGE
ncbi:hypothetical protein ACQEVB_06340 [Pseudonocardia sp. CA-107938]|uniref:hypothetical protein n=1 Tax=Pseudonocardia sp. CA-107938 TaxID=3240021 RepID=UPI003D94D85A